MRSATQLAKLKTLLVQSWKSRVSQSNKLPQIMCRTALEALEVKAYTLKNIPSESIMKVSTLAHLPTGTLKFMQIFLCSTCFGWPCVSVLHVVPVELSDWRLTSLGGSHSCVEAHSFRGPPAEMEKHMQPEQTRKHHT
eukprot:4571786-Amphidinium_carterae.1